MGVSQQILRESTRRGQVHQSAARPAENHVAGSQAHVGLGCDLHEAGAADAAFDNRQRISPMRFQQTLVLDRQIAGQTGFRLLKLPAQIIRLRVQPHGLLFKFVGKRLCLQTQFFEDLFPAP